MYINEKKFMVTEIWHICLNVVPYFIVDCDWLLFTVRLNLLKWSFLSGSDFSFAKLIMKLAAKIIGSWWKF